MDDKYIPGSIGTTATFVCFPITLSSVKALTLILGKLEPCSLLAVTVITYMVNGFKSLITAEFKSFETVTLISDVIFVKASWSNVCNVVTLIVYVLTLSVNLDGGDQDTCNDFSFNGST